MTTLLARVIFPSVIKMFENVKKVEFELRNLFLLLAGACFALSAAGVFETGSIGYAVATVLSAILIIKLSSDASAWARENITGPESTGHL